MNETRDKPVSIGVLAKVNQILTLFAEQLESAGPTEIAELLGMNKSTAFRLLSSLAQMGLLDSEPETGQYRLGLRLLQLGHVVQERLSLLRTAQPILRQLALRTGFTAFVCSRRGDYAVCLDRIPGQNVDILELQPGGRLPLHVGGAGKALLAGMSDAELSEYATPDRLRARDSQSALSPQSLVNEIEDVRVRGYALSNEDVTPGIAAIGAPIFNARDEVVGAVSVSGLAVAVLGDDKESHAMAVVSAAEAISSLLGYRKKNAPATLPK